MKKLLWICCPIVLLLLAVLILPSQTVHTFCALDQTCTWTGIQTFNNVAQINTIYMGNQYATVQAAINAANPSNTGGVVYIPIGAYVGPTTIPDNTRIYCLGAPVNSNMIASFGVATGNATPQCIFNYSASLSLTNAHNIEFRGIEFNFQNSTTNGIVITSSSGILFNDYAVVGCGGTACVQLLSSAGTVLQNTIRNEFNRGLVAPTNSNGSVGYTGFLFNANSASGPAVTLNRITDTVISSNLLCGVDFENSSDSNFLEDVYVNQDAPNTITNSAAICINQNTPGSDIDADAFKIDSMTISGIAHLTAFIRTGQTTGAFIRLITNQQSLTANVTVLGGTPQFAYESIQLSTGYNDLLSSRITASGNSGTIGPASGATAGDITAAETATSGIVYLGTDGVAVYRVSSSPVSALNCVKGSIAINSGATNASTVLYVCGATNTWTAVTAP